MSNTNNQLASFTYGRHAVAISYQNTKLGIETKGIILGLKEKQNTFAQFDENGKFVAAFSNGAWTDSVSAEQATDTLMQALLTNIRMTRKSQPSAHALDILSPTGRVWLAIQAMQEIKEEAENDNVAANAFLDVVTSSKYYKADQLRN